MKQYLQNPSDLGPWNPDRSDIQLIYESKFVEVSKQSVSSPKRKNDLVFPRMIQHPKHDLQRRYKKSMKLKPLRLQIDSHSIEELNQTKKSKTLSFEPPALSFYHKKQVRKAKKHQSNFSHLNPREDQETLTPLSHRISKVELLCPDTKEDINQNAENSKKSNIGKTSQHQFAKKRSIMEVIRYLKAHDKTPNRAAPQSMMTKLGQFQEIQHIADCYVPGFKKSFPHRNKRYL